MFNKVYFWFDVVGNDEYKKIFHIFKKGKDYSFEEIWEKYPLVGGFFNPNKMTKEIAGIELMLFKKFLDKENLIKEENFEIIFGDKNQFFIFNEKLFQILDGKIIEINLNGTLFTTLRSNFIHPFFQILSIISKKKGGIVKKINSEIGKFFGCQNKFFGNIALYQNREKFLGNFFLPFKINKKNFGLVKEFLLKNFGEKIVIKKDCIQMGAGVSLIDLKKFDKIQEKKFLHYFNNQERIFITEYFKIKNEFRVYFNKFDKKVKIYSIKKRVNKTSENDLIKKDNFKIYESLKTEWELIELKDFGKKELNFCIEVLINTKFDTGCLEFVETFDGKFRFIEINQMSGPLPFVGNDIANIHGYYLDIFKKIVKNND